MVINTDNLVSITEANQNFSRVARMVDENGAVLGVNTYGSNLDQNLFYAVSATEVTPILQRNSITFTMADEAVEPEQKEGSGSTLNPIFIAASAVLLVAIAVLLLVRKNGRRQNDGAVIRSFAPQHGGMTVHIKSVPIMAGRDSTCCAILYRDGTPGVSSRHCQIQFAAREQQFTVTDLGSTYGTLLSNGQRLNPNQPVKLADGSEIYLGEPDNILRLELN